MLNADQSGIDSDVYDAVFAVNNMLELIKTYLKELHLEAEAFGLHKEPVCA